MTGICELYLTTHGGDMNAFMSGIESRQRFGEAFFNALSTEDQGRLTGTRHDCFYNNSKVYDAIEYLLSVGAVA